MSKVYHFTELVGTSEVDFQDALSQGVAEAKRLHANMRWFEVLEQRGYVCDEGATYYQVHIKIGYSP